jgi:uncharacterized protein (DUF1501 family)
MKRREFLQTAGLCALSLIAPGISGWAASAGNAGEPGNKLVVVFLRGAVDGLNVVVPHGDSHYYSSRPSIAIPKPGQEGGALDLDGYFGLHPSLDPLMQFWKDGTLAFVNASGSPDPTRSHFDAQDFMESGTPGVKLTSSGWMNRLLSKLPGGRSPVRCLNIGETMPRILQGPASVASYEPAGNGVIQKKAIDLPVVSQLFQSMYGGRTDELGKSFNEGMSARKTIKKDLESEMMAANQGAPDARNFKGFGNQLGTLFSKDPSVQMGFLAIGGWDTHINQGSSKGQLANKLTALGTGLNDLVSALGAEYKNTLIVVMSEFGRTVKENGNAGTDHGHGNVMMLMGGRVAGGKVHGKWKGLEGSQLYEGRDLAVTTDFRSVLWSTIAEHLKVASSDMKEIFPAFEPGRSLMPNLFKA